MAGQGNIELFSFEKREDQLIIGVFVCLLLSLIFGLQPGTEYAILWAALGGIALLLIYFAFPNTWTYSLLLYAIYAISAFGIIIVFFWGDQLLIGDVSIAVFVGAFLFGAALYMSYHIIQSIKKARDAQSKEAGYVPLGFWSIGVMLFFGFSFLSVLGWAFSVNSGGSGLQIYLVLEPIIALLLVYILWLPDRNIDWSIKDIPESPATKFITAKTDSVKQKVTKIRNICPECGLKLKIEKKTCPSCGKTQTFGWCVRSEAHVLPCANCGNMALYGKEKCDKCGKKLSEKVTCNSCQKEFQVKDWISES
jgi:hypothetical protein